MDFKSVTNYNIRKFTPFDSNKEKRKESRIFFVIRQKLFIKASILIIVL